MKKILIANRGEIAVRIIRTAKQMGIKTVAVYSDADRRALHVRMADEAYRLGPAPSNQSYLLADKIIEIALQTGTDGIHPGYGFLSENAAFARKVAKAGIKFIGPSPDSIDLMGSKLAAKEAAAKYDTPMVPGTDYALSSVDEAVAIGNKIGYPLLIKASAGGGGKGMRIVENAEELPEQMKRASSEALSAFGDGSVFIEKFVVNPRHVEIQVLGDQHGNIIYLFERECSIQRRHQKVVEEAPSAILTESLRRQMGESAVKVAKSCGYYSAGTVEFLVDKDLNFYFLEMNTRLQVEHPVTELISGLDLVEQQIRIADGETLTFKQSDLMINGHAIELRVYAEDPTNDFLPSVGKLVRYQLPEGPGIRVDNGMEENMDIPIYYDPMIAKLAVWGENRNAAIAKMKLAIDNYLVEGAETTLTFGRFVMDHPAFISGDFDTNFVQRHFTKEAFAQYQEGAEISAGQLSAWLYKQHRDQMKEIPNQGNNWKAAKVN